MWILSKQNFLAVLLSCIVLFAASVPVRAHVVSVDSFRVEFVTGELQGLIYFVNWFANHEGSTVLYSKFCREHPLTESDLELLRRYKSSFGNESRYQRRLELETTAAHVESLEELVQMLPSRFSQNDSDIAVETLQHFAPSYRKFIWHDLENAAQKRVLTLQDEADKGRLLQRLQRVKKLFGSNLKDCVLTVVVVILPDEALPEAGHDAHCDIITSAENSRVVAVDKDTAGQLSFVECMPGHDAKIELCTVFHELCHTLWYNRLINRATKFRASFLAHDGAGAYRAFEEAAPTALGSGWYAELITKKPSPFWYSGKTIAPYAESLLPLLKKYLAGNRTLDADFAHEATEAYVRVGHKRE